MTPVTMLPMAALVLAAPSPAGPGLPAAALVVGGTLAASVLALLVGAIGEQLGGWRCR